MIFDIIQTSKELYSACFEINRGQNQIGGFFVQGSLASVDAKISGNFCGINFDMQRGSSKDIDDRKPYRPYFISNNGIINGVVYETEHNGGWLKKYEFGRMQLKGMTFDLFTVSFGKDGTKSLLYCGNRQIAQINSESVVYNDLHNYRIYAVDDYAAEKAVLFIAYLYVLGLFEPGKKVISSVTKYYSKTTNKELLSKYNPDFINSIVE